MRIYLLVTIYLTTTATANLVLAAVGAWSMPILALLFIGLDMTLRDYLHAEWERKRLWLRMLLLISGGSLLAWIVNPSSQIICLASAIAFLLSSIVDTLIYAILQNREWMYRANASNIGSSLVDTLTFSYLAFSTIEWFPLSLAYLMKVGAGILCSLLFLRCSLHPNRDKGIAIE